jgi:hypothetical protein
MKTLEKLKLLQGLLPLEWVQSDVINRLHPESGVQLNSTGAWLVTQNVRSGLKAKQAAESLNEILPRLIEVLEWVEDVANSKPDANYTDDAYSIGRIKILMAQELKTKLEGEK